MQRDPLFHANADSSDLVLAAFAFFRPTDPNADAVLAPFGAPGTLVLAAGLVWEGVTVTGGIVAGLSAFVASRRNTTETPRSR